MLKRIKLCRTILTGLFVMLLLLCLPACSSAGLKLDQSMQEELDARDPGPPRFFPAEEESFYCEEHIRFFRQTKEHHTVVCNNCGTELSDPQPHKAVVFDKGVAVIDGRMYIVFNERCSCGLCIRKEYQPYQAGQEG